jgi:hypothetical protein
MSGWRSILALAIGFVLAIATAALAEDAPPTSQEAPTLAQLKAKSEMEKLAEVATLPIIKAKSIADVMQLSLNNKDLKVTTSLAPTSGEGAIVRTPDLPGVNQVTVMRLGNDPTRADAPISLDFTNLDYSAPDVVSVKTMVSSQVSRLDVSQFVERVDDETQTVQLIQNDTPGEGEPRIFLHVQNTAKPPVNLHIPADNLVALRRAHPAETAKYIDPMFRLLHQDGLLSHVDPRLAWQVFASSYVASSDLQSAVKAVVAKLDADSFQDRETASQELQKLGQPAALVLMRMDRKQLSDEQTGRIDAFLATFNVVPEAEVARLHQDRDFLLDCLYSEDEAIRTQALAELRKLTGQPIEFNLSADPEHRLAAINRLRESFGAAAATQTTQPN